jgi:dephospho-CoA kinase
MSDDNQEMTFSELNAWVAKEASRIADELEIESDKAMKDLLSINDEQLAELKNKLHREVRQLGQLSLAKKPPFSLSN